MSFKESVHSKYQVLHLDGEIDLYNSPKVRSCILKLLSKSSLLAIDFTELKYIDSSGIATLVEALNIAREEGGELFLSGASGAPRKVLELTRLNKVFKMVDSLEDLPE